MKKITFYQNGQWNEWGFADSVKIYCNGKWNAGRGMSMMIDGEWEGIEDSLDYVYDVSSIIDNINQVDLNLYKNVLFDNENTFVSTIAGDAIKSQISNFNMPTWTLIEIDPGYTTPNSYQQPLYKLTNGSQTFEVDPGKNVTLPYDYRDKYKIFFNQEKMKLYTLSPIMHDIHVYSCTRNGQKLYPVIQKSQCRLLIWNYGTEYSVEYDRLRARAKTIFEWDNFYIEKLLSFVGYKIYNKNYNPRQRYILNPLIASCGYSFNMSDIVFYDISTYYNCIRIIMIGQDLKEHGYAFGMIEYEGMLMPKISIGKYIYIIEDTIDGINITAYGWQCADLLLCFKKIAVLHVKNINSIKMMDDYALCNFMTLANNYIQEDDMSGSSSSEEGPSTPAENFFNTTISNQTITIDGNDTARYVMVNEHGIVNVMEGGHIDELTVGNLGTVNVQAGGTVNNAVINSGLMVLSN